MRAGYDVENRHAVSIRIFNDPDKVEFVPVTIRRRLPARRIVPRFGNDAEIFPCHLHTNTPRGRERRVDDAEVTAVSRRGFARHRPSFAQDRVRRFRTGKIRRVRPMPRSAPLAKWLRIEAQ